MKTALSLFVPAALFLSAASAFAASPEQVALESYEQPKQCAVLIQECFQDEGRERTDCFFSRSQHPFCNGTELGKLTYRRWIMSPVRAPGVDGGTPGFLGPQLVDQECLSNFDNLFVAALLEQDGLGESLQGLKGSLSECTRDISDSLTRP